MKNIPTLYEWAGDMSTFENHQNFKKNKTLARSDIQINKKNGLPIQEPDNGFVEKKICFVVPDYSTAAAVLLVTTGQTPGIGKLIPLLSPRSTS